MSETNDTTAESSVNAVQNRTSQDELIWLFSKEQLEKRLPGLIKEEFGSNSVTPAQIKTFVENYIKPLIANGSIPKMQVVMWGDMYTGDIKIVLEVEGVTPKPPVSEAA